MSITRARSLRRRLSPPEARLWNAVRNEQMRHFHFRRQVPIGPYFADFASHMAKLVIEIDGAQHFTDEAQDYDARRTAFIETQGYRVLRFTTIDVMDHLGGVFGAILAAAQMDGDKAEES